MRIRCERHSFACTRQQRDMRPESEELVKARKSGGRRKGVVVAAPCRRIQFSALPSAWLISPGGLDLNGVLGLANLTRRTVVGLKHLAYRGRVLGALRRQRRSIRTPDGCQKPMARLSRTRQCSRKMPGKEIRPHGVIDGRLHKPTPFSAPSHATPCSASHAAEKSK